MQIHLQKGLSIIYIHSSLQLLQHDIDCPGQQQVGTRMSSKERCATLMQTDILMLRFQENLCSTWVIMGGSFKRGSSRLICLGLLSTSGHYHCLFCIFICCMLFEKCYKNLLYVLTYLHLPVHHSRANCSYECRFVKYFSVCCSFLLLIQNPQAASSHQQPKK